MSTKTHWFTRGLLLAATATAVVSASAADGTWVKRDGVGTGGTNWANWNDTENWVDGEVASGSSSVANLKEAKKQYIRLPDTTVSLKRVYGISGQDPILCGDGQLTYVSPSGDSTGLMLYTKWAYWNNSAYQGLYSLTFCGDCMGAYWATLWCGTSYVRLDYYANSSDPVRPNAFFASSPSSIHLHSDAGMVFIAPHGSSTNNVSSWSQTAGSPFLAPVGGHVTHALPAGTIVTGDGIPADTFLKRIFPDGTIELSAAVTESADANELTFAAFTSKTTVTLKGYYSGYNSGGLKWLAVQKYREEDDIRFNVTHFRADSGGDVNRKFRIYTEEGFLPGVIAVYEDSAELSYLTLENVNLELDANATGMELYVPTATHSARVAVTGALEKAVGKVKNVTGTLTKVGTGTLVVNELGANTGYVTVAEGCLCAKATTADASIGTLTIKAGARFDVPTGGIDCGTLVAEPGAIVGGSGELRYANAAAGVLENITVTGGALVVSSDAPTGELELEFLGAQPGTYAGDDCVIYVLEQDTTVRVSGSGTVGAMVVAGGGGGGGDRGGGGGGGGVLTTSGYMLKTGLYGVQVGAGGTAGDVAGGRKHGGNGGNSAAFGLMAIGGGGGGTRAATLEGSAGGSGGGGGGPYYHNGGRYTLGGAGTAGQGYAGGMSTNINKSVLGGKESYSAGGGGGGAGEPGHNATLTGTDIKQLTSRSGNGGDGIECPFWKGRWFGGGGGGGSGAGYTSAGGKGGGGKGGIANNQAGHGTDGLGGGGGGGGCSGEGSWGQSGKGGRGVVLLCVPLTAAQKAKVYDQPIATGGDIRRRKGYAVHTFSADGTFAVPEDTLVDVLVVGGGASGGCHAGGGGGGGGVVVVSNLFLLAGSYPVTVGAGGAAVSSGAGKSGANSVFSQPNSSMTTVTALGGGRGGYRDDLPSVGGCGGGAGARYFAYVTACHTDGAAGTDGQGFGGGASTNDTKRGTKLGEWQTSAGGGGGGAATNGCDAVATTGGKGGDGVFCDFSGREAYYGGGGGGGSTRYLDAPYYLAAGGLGGGGRGGSARYDGTNVYGKNGEAGTDGLGGGGGGGGMASDSAGLGGKGGDGTVIIRYRVQPIGLTLTIQ